VADNRIEPVSIRKITALTNYEREMIRVALDDYIEKHGARRAWSQKVIRDEILPLMFWGSL
jgi:hypothetical protein